MTETPAPGGEPRRTILIVDGDDRVRRPLADFLQVCGYEVIEAVSTEEAWQALHDESAAVDVVLCDFAAPGQGSALDLAVWARRERPELNFVLTGNFEAEALAAAELCEEAPHLERPYVFDKVLAHIRQILGQ